jgi:hypothetical protein
MEIISILYLTIGGFIFYLLVRILYLLIRYLNLKNQILRHELEKMTVITEDHQITSSD